MAEAPNRQIEASLCENCFEVFFSKKQYNVHTETCTEMSPAVSKAGNVVSSSLSKCNQCKRIFLGADHLEDHVKRDHSNTKAESSTRRTVVMKTVLQCDTCMKIFMDATLLQKHIQLMHPGRFVKSESPTPAAKPESNSWGLKTPPVRPISPVREVAGDSASKVKTEEDALTCAASTNEGPDDHVNVTTIGEQGEVSGSGDAMELVEESLLLKPVDNTKLPEETALSDSVADTTTQMADSVNMEMSLDQSTLSEPVNSTTVEDDAATTERMLMESLTSQLEVVHGEAAEGPTTNTSPKADDISTTTTDTCTTAAADTSNMGTLQKGMTFYACSYCNIMFTAKDPLIKHLEGTHADKAKRVEKKPPSTKPTFACGMCSMKYSTMNAVQKHLQREHSKRWEEIKKSIPGRLVESFLSTMQCEGCPKLQKYSTGLLDKYMNLDQWIEHYYGDHQRMEKLKYAERLHLHPCRHCGITFMSRASRLHHNVIDHDGNDPEEQTHRSRAEAEQRPSKDVKQGALSPKYLSTNVRSNVIVDSLMKPSLASLESPAEVSGEHGDEKRQNKCDKPHSRVTQVVFKCSKCGVLFADEFSFEKHAREAHKDDIIAAKGDKHVKKSTADEGDKAIERSNDQKQIPKKQSVSKAVSLEPAVSLQPVEASDVFVVPPQPGDRAWDVMRQRECGECSTLLEPCPRSSALFVYRPVWERHVTQVHAAAPWRCTGKVLVMHPCDRCERLFLHPDALTKHKEKLHDTMLDGLSREEVEASTRTDTAECSKCDQLVQNADGLCFLEGGAWREHFEGEHKRQLLSDGSAGHWKLTECTKCHRLFFNEKDLPKHEARQAYMHMPLPPNVKVKTPDGPKSEDEMELLYQCANDNCPFSTRQQPLIISHSKECQYASPAQFGATVLYKTILVRKPLKKAKGPTPKSVRRLRNVIEKLGGGAPENRTETEPAECLPLRTRSSEQPDGSDSPDALTVVENVPEAAAEEEAVISEEPSDVAEGAQTSSDADANPTMAMKFSCSICNEIGASRDEIVAHIKDAHRGVNIPGKFVVKFASGKARKMTIKQRSDQVKNYLTAYLCFQCKMMAKTCSKTRDLYFEKEEWLNHLRTTHEPAECNEMDRMELSECTQCTRLLISTKAHTRHIKYCHTEGVEAPDLRAASVRAAAERRLKYRLECCEEGCDFRYQRASQLRAHLISEHNFDLAVREVLFYSEQEFQSWRKQLELETGSCFILRSTIVTRKKQGTFQVRYHECSRVKSGSPAVKPNGRKRRQRMDALKADMVWKCPAFLKAEVPITKDGPRQNSILVTFCPNHYGHEMDPTFGRLSDAEEAEIADMLISGLPISDVVRRVRCQARQEGAPSRRQRITEAEVNRIYEKHLGVKPPRWRRFYPDLPDQAFGPKTAEARRRTVKGEGAERDERLIFSPDRKASQKKPPVAKWDPDCISSSNVAEEEDDDSDSLGVYDNGADAEYEQQEYGEESYETDERERQQEVEHSGARDRWQRLCGEEGCDFTTNSVGSLRYHLRSQHGFAMHIDSVYFPTVREFNQWKLSLEKRTCAKYACYKTVTSDDPEDPYETRYFTCHRSGLVSLKRPSSTWPLPRRLVLCTGYMKLKLNQTNGEVNCEYCASHYGHDAHLVHGGSPAQYVGSYDAQPAPPYDAQPPSSYDAKPVPSYDAQPAAAYDHQQAPTYDSQQAPTYDSQQAPSYDSQQAPTYDSQQAPAYDSQQAPTYVQTLDMPAFESVEVQADDQGAVVLAAPTEPEQFTFVTEAVAQEFAQEEVVQDYQEVEYSQVVQEYQVIQEYPSEVVQYQEIVPEYSQPESSPEKPRRGRPQKRQAEPARSRGGKRRHWEEVEEEEEDLDDYDGADDEEEDGDLVSD